MGEGKSEGKGAISPLVATILLVAFSVGIGAIVMSWGENFVEQKADFVQGVREVVNSCDAVSFNIIRLGGVPQICSRANVLETTIDNGADIDVYDFNVRLLGTGGAYTDESVLNAELKRLHAVKIAVPFPNIGRITQVKLTPKIRVGDDILFCSNEAVVAENILQC